MDADALFHDARKWLRGQGGTGKNYVSRYATRYRITKSLATTELYSLGYYENVYREELESKGISCKYILTPLTGELELVAEGAEEHELFI